MWLCDPYSHFCLLFSFIIYLFGCTRSWSQPTGSSLFTGTYEIFSCRMWDLLPRPTMEPRLAALGALSLSHWTTGEVLTFIYFWLEFQLSVIIQVSLTDQIFWSAAQLCPTFCGPVDCSLPGSSAHGVPGKNTGVSCQFLLQGIFPTQGSTPSLPKSQADSFTVSATWEALYEYAPLPFPHYYPLRNLFRCSFVPNNPPMTL